MVLSVGDATLGTTDWPIALQEFQRVEGDPPLWICDASPVADKLDLHGSAIPTLDADAAVPGLPCGVVWRPCDHMSPSIEARRIRRFDNRGVAMLIPALSADTIGAPVYSVDGRVLGVCGDSRAADGETACISLRATIATIEMLVAKGAPTVANGPDSAPLGLDSPKGANPDRERQLGASWTNSALLPEAWGNREGLDSLTAWLGANGFDTIIRWQIVQLSGGIQTGLYGALDSIRPGGSALGVVSEAASDSLDLRVWQPCARDLLGQDRSEERIAAVELSHPNMPGANITVWEQTRTSNARVLLIEAGTLPTSTGTARGGEGTGLPASDGKLGTSAPDAPPLNPDGPIVVLPMRGGVGALPDESEGFFTALDLDRALTEAYRLHPSAIVLEIDSGGGRVDTKEAVLRTLLTGSARGQRFVAAIHDAGSAAALIALGCKELLTFPGSRMGAAVTIQVGDEGVVSFKKLLENDPELEKKLSSFADAMDIEAALVTSRSPAISSAMKHSEAELWWSPTKGFASTRTAADSELLDGPQTVLTLTHTRMLQTGLSKQIVSMDSLGEMLGMDANRKVILLDRPMSATFNRLKTLSELAETASPAQIEALRREAVELLIAP